MDPSVLSAIRKWPDVPDVFGWLSLDLRGNWRLKGDVIANPGICEFIGRNYAADPHGRWFFQNGPQRVFVSLAYAPFAFFNWINPIIALLYGIFCIKILPLANEPDDAAELAPSGARPLPSVG